MESPKIFEVAAAKAPKITDDEMLLDSDDLDPPPISISAPTPPADEFALSTEEMKRIGPQLAARLEELDYHPVVIFGSSNSGKSSFLGSLLAFFKQSVDLEIGIYLGDPVLSTDTAYGRYVRDAAEAFFHRSIQEFIDGVAHQATKTRYPFFVPVVVRPKHHPELRFAFLESNGEWYQAQRDTSQVYPRLKGEIEGVLQHFQRGISVVYIAPFTQASIRDEPVNKLVDQTEVTNAGLALVGVMEAYEALRSIKSSDDHMFLVTKWDAYTKPHYDLKDVLTSTSGDVEEVVTEKYQQAFASFKNLALAPRQRSLMQYCSGLISGRIINKPNNELQPIINRYRQTLWNWLYANASRNNKDIEFAITLMPTPPPPRKTVLERLYEILDKVLH